MSLHVLEILRSYNIDFTSTNEDFLTVLCPFHDDHNPTGYITVKSGKFRCRACPATASLYSYVAKRTGRQLRDVYSEVNKRYYQEKDDIVNPLEVERAYKNLLNYRELIAELHHRCVTDELIQKYRIGYYQGRVSIPITNPIGEFVNLRLYDPTGKSEAKFINLPGRRKRKTAIFPEEQMSYDIIMICGGELKAIVAAEELNKYNIGAVSLTCGEMEWEATLSSRFQGKYGFICNDVDATGDAGAEKRCKMLYPFLAETRKLVLPLDKTKYPKGDINDFKRIGGMLFPLLNDAPVWKPPLPVVDDSGPPEEMQLEQAISAESTKKRFSLRGIVSSMDESPYSIPKDVKINCTRDQDFCAMCPIFINFTDPALQKGHIKGDSVEILSMVGKETKSQHAALKRTFGIPARCKECSFDATTHFNVQEVRVSALLDIKSRSTERAMQLAYVVGPMKVELNESYRMVGKMYPHPDTQQATLLINEYEATADALSTYTPGDIKPLQELFCPSEWTLRGIEDKLNDIYEDFETNVTRIFARRDMHLLIDLAYHSPLFVQFMGTIQNGWVQVLIMGDSSQGKSEAAKRMQDHYGLGAWIDCKSASVAGLLGGIDEQGGRRFISWGEIPNNDRRLAIMDELKGTDKRVIAALTSMRSTGIAEITKIVKRKAHARTRLVALSNPREEKRLNEYNYGIDAALELIGTTEDVRRFDALMIVDERDITIDQTQHRPAPREHKYNCDLSRELVLLAWTIPNTRFEDEGHILEVAASLCNTYTETIPIVDRGSMRYKVAKLASSLAMRTASFEAKDTVLVRRCHVEYIDKFLRGLYDRETCGYGLLSIKLKEQFTLADPESIEKDILHRWPHPYAVVDALLRMEDLSLFDLQDLCAWEKEDARRVLSELIRQRALKKYRNRYVKTQAFINLLRHIKPKTEAPEYLRRGSEF